MWRLVPGNPGDPTLQVFDDTAQYYKPLTYCQFANQIKVWVEKIGGGALGFPS